MDIGWFFELVKTQGALIACLSLAVWAWLSGNVISKGNHDTIVKLHMELTTLQRENGDYWRHAFGDVTPAASRSQDIAAKALDSLGKEPPR